MGLELVGVNLIAAWDLGEYFYQLWETQCEYVCQGIYSPTLQTVLEGRGNTPTEAIAEALRDALGALS